MSEPSLRQLLEAELAERDLVVMGEVAIRRLENGGFQLEHRSTGVAPAEMVTQERALEVAKFDELGAYRPLRTAPNLRHGWKITAADIGELIEVIDAIYPARLAAWRAWRRGRLTTTPLRRTLNRQTGMYRMAAKISEDEVDDLIGNFCRSAGGCLRTILWRRDDSGQIASTKLPPEKFDPAIDQIAAVTAVPGRGDSSAAAASQPRPATAAKVCIPLLCQEACNLLVAACRETVKSARTDISA